MRTQYGDLTEEREKDHPMNPVDPASYQDLIQDRKDGNLNLEGLTQGEENGEPLYCFPEESVPTEEDPRSPCQRSNFSECSPDHLKNVLKELKGVIKPNRAPSSDSPGEPIYYVLEESVPTKEDPGSPCQRSDSLGCPRDPMYNVVKELQEITNPNRAPSSDSLGEPIYYVLEESVSNKEDPGSPLQPSISSGSPRDPVYSVLKELQSVISPNRAPSSNSLGEPIYYVLENPEDIEGRDTRDGEER